MRYLHPSGLHTGAAFVDSNSPANVQLPKSGWLPLSLRGLWAHSWLISPPSFRLSCTLLA
ncbi:hypothetical protein GALMADRAFT_223848 [Galerina marginata CBS 339.88]|uniref:Uncharacterized protein n=1 Tax=Galerina marginata (strain CBS 339.88) TaxID=685588 RepID=A0A067T621_GALM3|nr:hypothetical protein GALMADRAFT_223848 [Galerina marginata CBS 339.88]